MKRAIAAAMLLAAAPLPALAEVDVSIEQGKVVIARDAQGNAVETVMPLDKAVPGETVVYRYLVVNRGAAPAADVMVSTAVPENMTYTEGSGAAHGWIFEVSADGRTFAPEGALIVYEIDETSRPAEARDIRRLRWRLGGSIAPGEARRTAFRATLDR